MTQLATVARLIFMTGSLLAMLALHDQLVHPQAQGRDTYAAYLCSLVYLSVLLYYGLGKLALLAAAGPARLPAAWSEWQIG